MGRCCLTACTCWLAGCDGVTWTVLCGHGSILLVARYADVRACMVYTTACVAAVRSLMHVNLQSSWLVCVMYRTPQFWDWIAWPQGLGASSGTPSRHVFMCKHLQVGLQALQPLQ